VLALCVLLTACTSPPTPPTPPAAPAPLPAPAAAKRVYEKRDFGGTRTDFDFDGGRGFVIAPTAPAADGTKPWLWYAPTLNAHPGKELTWLFTRLLAQGFFVAGADVGETYGNPAARRGFDRFYRHVTRTFGLDAKACLFAQSRGGLNHYHFAAAHPERVRCIAGIYPVADLRSYPTLARAAPVYGLTADELSATLGEHNPIEQLAPIARAGIPILHLHGDSDRLVPLGANSGALAARYRTLGGRMRLVIVPGIGHQALPVFFESPELLRFLLARGKGLEPGDVRLP
jgi:pimeloyl-ACP methyl ester carboxylesterase